MPAAKRKATTKMASTAALHGSEATGERVCAPDRTWHNEAREVYDDARDSPAVG